MRFSVNDVEIVEGFTTYENDDPSEEEEIPVFSTAPASINQRFINEILWDQLHESELDITNRDQNIYVKEWKIIKEMQNSSF